MRKMQGHDLLGVVLMLNWVITDYEPGDGTNYTLHVMKHMYGGYLVCCNDDSMWIAFKDGKVIHLASPLDAEVVNEWTRSAISDYILGLGLE